MEKNLVLLPPRKDISRGITQVEKNRLLTNLSLARSENTRKTYEGAWMRFTAWCEGQDFQSFPAEPWVVALYVQYLSDAGKKASTLTTALSAIQAFHEDNGLNISLFKNHLVKSTLVACRRQMVADGRSQVSKPSVFSEQEITELITRTHPHSLQGFRDRALLSLGFNSGLRASEIGSLTPSDISFDDHGMTITVRSSKGDQLGSGETFYIQALAPKHRVVDAVWHMRRWLEMRESAGSCLGTDSPVFFGIRKGGHTPYLTNGRVNPLTRQGISKLVHSYAEMLDLDGKYSAHSFRHSFATQAFGKGISATRIAKVTRHKNLKVLSGYDQTTLKANAFNLNLWD